MQNQLSISLPNAKNKQVKFTYKILFLLSLFACFLANAQTSVQFQFANGQYNIAQYTNVTVILQPEQLNVSGGVTLGTAQIYQTTDTNASTTFSNLSGSYTGGYYHWTVPAFTSPNGFNPPTTIQGDIQVTSTNLGLISSTTIGVVFVPVYNGSGAAWTAQASDLRYSQTTNVLTSYVQIGQLNSTSNSIVAQIPSTNGFITTNNLAQYATTNYVNAATNNFTTIVYSNPASYTTPSFVTNAINALATTNGVNATTATNIAAYQAQIATNALSSTNYVVTAIASATNGLANTNLLSSYTTITVFTAGTNSVATNSTAQLIATNAALVASMNTSIASLSNSLFVSSNLLQNTKQPSSLILSNLALTGAFTNILNAGLNVNFTTNFSGNTISINATNQTFLTNGFGSIVTHAQTDYILTNALPALTNGFVMQSVTNGLATISYVNSQAASGVGFTNGLNAGLNVTFTTNFSGSIVSINATNQTFLTNGFGSIVTHAATDYISTNALPALTNQFLTSASLSTYATTGYVATAIAGAGINTNNFLAGQNVTFTTNFSGTIISINATNQTFLTNTFTSLATTNPSAVLYTNALPGLTNGFLTAGATNTIWTNSVANFYPLSNPSNYISSAGFTNANQFVASQNGQVTNLALQGVFVMGTKTNFVYTANAIGLGSSGSMIAGTYYGTSTLMVNPFYTNYSISYSGGNYYAMSNTVTEYASTNAVNWTQVSGALPVPRGDFGHYDYDNGTVYLGWFCSTNLTWQITNNISQYSFLYSSNQIYNLILATAINPTNGVTATQVTNICNYLISTQPLNGTNITTGTIHTNTFGADVFALINSSGGSGTTNFLLSGVVTNWTTNTIFSASGTNGIKYIATNFCIPNLNGNGTNTTLYTSPSILVTNLSVIGNTSLNNSNLNVSLVSGSQYLTTSFTNNTLNFAYAFFSESFTAPTNQATSINSLGFYNLNFTNATGQIYLLVGVQTNMPPNNTILYSNVLSLSSNNLGQFVYSQVGSAIPLTNGASYTVLFNTTNSATYNLINCSVNTNFLNTVYGYGIPIGTNFGIGANTLQYGPVNFLFNGNGTAAYNYVSNSVEMDLYSTNGIGVNTNYCGTNAFVVNGSTYISGNLIVGGNTVTTNSGGGGSSVYNQLFVTSSGATDASSNYAGIYSSAGNGVYTNALNNWYLVPPYYVATSSSNSVYFGNSYYFQTNLFNFTNQIAFTNQTLLGTYNPFILGTGTLIVSPYFTNSTQQSVYWINRQTNSLPSAIRPAICYTTFGGEFFKTNSTYDTNGWSQAIADHP